MVQINDVYGRLLVISDPSTEGRRRKVKVFCECGTVKVVEEYNLRRGHTKSCGCLQKEKANRCRTTHGQTGTRLYDVWRGMHQRCRDPSREYYHGHGITICGAWVDFGVFQAWAQEAGYKDDLSIDRIDGDQGYCPENCRFTTATVQSQNRRKQLNNTSGYIGVIPHRNRWQASARHAGRQVYLGLYDDPMEAARVRDDYVHKHYESPTLNFPEV